MNDFCLTRHSDIEIYFFNLASNHYVVHDFFTNTPNRFLTLFDTCVWDVRFTIFFIYIIDEGVSFMFRITSSYFFALMLFFDYRTHSNLYTLVRVLYSRKKTQNIFLYSTYVNGFPSGPIICGDSNPTLENLETRKIAFQDSQGLHVIPCI